MLWVFKGMLMRVIQQVLLKQSGKMLVGRGQCRSWLMELKHKCQASRQSPAPGAGRCSPAAEPAEGTGQ